jgi:D-glycero-D-manno-heptose 1,7-bisphosphate phosphatase
MTHTTARDVQSGSRIGSLAEDGMLILFDLDGTLISSYMDVPDRNYNQWEVLPGRKERIAKLLHAGHQLGIVTNQAGVAFGHVTEDEVYARLAEVIQAVELPLDTPIAVSFAHAKARIPRYRDLKAVRRRKPSGLMIRELMQQFPDAAADGVIYVGDRPDDEGAAADAGVAFVPADTFFDPNYEVSRPERTR